MNYKYSGIENDLFLRAQLQHMVKNPSDGRMQGLENIFDDMSVDFSTKDFGEQPNKSNYEPIIGECLEEEI